LVDTATMIA